MIICRATLPLPDNNDFLEQKKSHPNPDGFVLYENFFIIFFQQLRLLEQLLLPQN